MDSVGHASLWGFEVTLAYYGGNPYVTLFTVNVKGGSVNETCYLQRHAKPLKCSFTGLYSGSQYTIGAVACTPRQQMCSQATKKTAWTIPQRKEFQQIMSMKKGFSNPA